MLRHAEQRDISRIKALMRSEPGFWQDCWREDVIERALATADGLAFVWEKDGQILGFACAHDIGFRAYLSELIVQKPARGRGVGRQLVERMHQEFMARGCEILISDVWRDAEDFYRSLGWRKTGVKLMCKHLKE